jgi:hypothetical protein
MGEHARLLIVSVAITAALAGIAALVGAAAVAHASPGSSCQHTPQCGHGEVCLADGPFSTVGHCARIRILP